MKLVQTYIFHMCVCLIPSSPTAPPSLVKWSIFWELEDSLVCRDSWQKSWEGISTKQWWQASLVEYGSFGHTSVTLRKLPVPPIETSYILLDMLSSFWDRKKKEKNGNPSLAELFPHCAICHNPLVPCESCHDYCSCGDLCVCTCVHACVCSWECVSLFVHVSTVMCVCT